jgi:hypothetical protein
MWATVAPGALLRKGRLAPGAVVGPALTPGLEGRVWPTLEPMSLPPYPPVPEDSIILGYMSGHIDERQPGELFTRLVPILYVEDLTAERHVYEALGMRVTYEGPEYPDFIALGTGTLEFGLERRENFRAEAVAQVLIWQLGVSDLDEAARLCIRAGLTFESQTHEPAEDWRYRTLRLVSPNGYSVVLEGPSE